MLALTRAIEHWIPSLSPPKIIKKRLPKLTISRPGSQSANANCNTMMGLQLTRCVRTSSLTPAKYSLAVRQIHNHVCLLAFPWLYTTLASQLAHQ